MSDMQKAVEEFLLRKLKGEAITPDEFADGYPQVRVELLAELQRAEQVRAAKLKASRDQASHGSSDGPGQPSTSQPGSSAQLQVRCPHCRQAMDVLLDTAWAELTCDGCGHEFSLVAQQDREARALTSISHFDLIERVGMGGFGTVWKALDTTLDRIVALKIPRKGQLDEQESEQFLREARSAAQIQHEHIVRVYEVGRDDDLIFIASEFIDGPTLAERIRDDRPGIEDATAMCQTITVALQCAHAAGVVHRDLKPGNILLDEQGEPHVADFGLAKRDAGEITITAAGALLGTPAFMAPEQARGQAHQSDARSDIYSLGVILFQLLTGELPFRGSSATLLHQVIHDEPPSPRKFNARVPRDLETICLRCLEKEPLKRFASAADLGEEFARCRAGIPIKTRPIGATERAVRWCRRRPWVATYAATTVAVLLLGTIVSTFYALKAHSESQRTQAALAESERYLYAAKMTMVDGALAAGNEQRGLALLDEYRADTDKAKHRHLEWHYWWRRIHQDQVAVYRDSAKLRSVAVAADGNLIVWGGNDGYLRLSDAKLKHVVRLTPAHPSEIYDVEVAAAGKLAASVSEDGTVHLWDLTDRALMRALQHPGGSSHTVAMSPDGIWIALFGADEHESTVELYRSGQFEMPAHTFTLEDAAFDAEFSPDSTRLLIALPSKIDIWKMPDGAGDEAAATPQRVDDIVGRGYQIATAADSDFIVVGGGLGGSAHPHTLFLYDGLTYQPRRDLGSFAEMTGISDLQVSPDSRLLSLACGNGQVVLIDVQTAQQLKVLRGHRHRAKDVAFLPTGARLVSVGDDQTVRLWQVIRPDSEDLVLPPAPESCPFWSLAFTSDSQRLVASHGAIVRVWNVSQRELSAELHVKNKLIRKLAVSPVDAEMPIGLIAIDNEPPFQTREKPAEILLWDGVSGTPSKLHSDIALDMMDAISFTPDGTAIGVGGGYGGSFGTAGPASRALLVALAGGSTTELLPRENEDPWAPHRMNLFAIRFSPDSSRVVTAGGRDRTVKIWDAASGDLLLSCLRPDNIYPVRSVDVAPDGTKIAASWGDGVIAVFEAASGQLSYSFVAHDGNSPKVVFTPDGQSLVSCSWDQTVKIWDASSGQLRTTLVGHPDRVEDVTISPDGKFIASVDRQDNIRLWDCRPVDD